MSERPTAPSQAAISRALGLSPAAVTKCKQQGMPVDSIEAARDWRAKHVRPRAPNADFGRSGALQRAERLGLLALEDFEAHATELRAALRALSRQDAGRVLLDVAVWDQLHGAELLAEVCGPVPAGRDDVDLQPSEILSFEEASDVLFDVACGRRRYTAAK